MHLQYVLLDPALYITTILLISTIIYVIIFVVFLEYTAFHVIILLKLLCIVLLNLVYFKLMMSSKQK